MGFLAQAKGEAIVLFDPEGTVVGLFGASEEVLGYSRADLPGLVGADFFIEQDRAKGFHQFELDVAREGSHSEDDRWHLRKDGSHIWATGTVSAVREANGELIGFAKVLRDRTDLRMQIETLENRLEAAIHKLGEIEVFLSTLGHEIRNPLAPLTTALHLVERLVDDKDLIAKPASIMRRQLAVLDRLANDLMDVSRSGSGKLTLRLERLHLQPVLDDTVAGFQEKAQASGVSLQAILPEAPILVCADPHHLQQIVLNLIENALKYTPAGGNVWVKAVEDGPDAVIRIEDTGVGIAPELLPRIFELFTQASSASTTGLGIGLALVRDLVAEYGGIVEARSPGLDKGSQFTVRLPLQGRGVDLTLP